MRRELILLALAAASTTGCELLLSSPTKVYGADDGSGGAGTGGDDPSTGGEGTTGGGGATGGGGSGGSGAGPSVGGGGNTSCPGPVEFFWDDPGDVGPWCSDNLDEGGALSVAGGMLRIDAGAPDWWFDAEQAPFVYQTICGSFSLVSRVSAAIEAYPHHGVGVVIRSVNAPHDWALFSLGHQEDAGTIETKLWTYLGGGQDSTQPAIGDHGAASGKLAVCRTSDGAFLFADEIDGDVPRSYPITANDFGFGSCVQVGFTVHEWWEQGDDHTAATASGFVDYAHFIEPVSDAVGCEGVAAWGL